MRWWKGYSGHVINVVEDPSKMPTLWTMTEEMRVEKVVDEGAKKGGEGKETGKDAMGDKAKLKAWFAS